MRRSILSFVLLVVSGSANAGILDAFSWLWEKIIGFFNWVRDTVNSAVDAINRFFVWVGDWITYWFDWVLLLPRRLWNEVLNALADWFAEIQPPDWLSSLGNYTSSIPCEVWALVQWAEMPVGIGIIVSALIIRFLIRRIPFIG